MSQFRFAEMGWLHAVWWVAGLVAILVYLELRRHSVLDRFLSRTMQPRLVTRASLTRRLASIGLLALSLACLVAAMMRPQWGVTVEQLTRVDSQIMVCLDVSRSMLAEDVAPNRLDRAKAELDSLFGLLDEGQQVGLIAFAGKAAVLCPMTTDFGFLRLVLREAGPGSVGLGGTKIGEALQQAVDGFGEAGDVHRLILLITDGEDHDSFPMDAARRARERGIRIVSIGFGDEAGSKIEITDPRTGVRSFVKDRQGNDVVSRLDGETLREIALETQGAYVPAGTGALDLESIYERHLETMLRGSANQTQRVHRNEAYQWPTLAALVLLMLGLITATPWSLKFQASARAADLTRATMSRAAILVLCVVLPTTAALGQPPAAAPPPPGSANEPDVAVDSAEQSSDAVSEDADGQPTSDEELVPRVAYNQSLAYVSSDPDRAERLLSQARRDAGADGELRYPALYNLGWVEVNRADTLLKHQPQEALEHLQQAAHRFREAIRVRPESDEARHNLEIISRRILELTDALAAKQSADLESRLDELIERLRASQAELGALVQLLQPADSATPEEHRRSFRQASIVQRQTIADLQKLVEDTDRELEALRQKPEQERKDEDRMREAQLAGVLRFAEGGLQRMHKARSLTRRMQADRAFTRWSAALRDTKRARDQLRNPIEVLGVLTADAEELAGLTRIVADEKTLAPQEQESPKVPAWLTLDYLQDSQESITERTAELTQLLHAATSGAATDEGAGDEADEQAEMQAQAQALIDQIRQALPHLDRAEDAFSAAVLELEGDRVATAHEKQLQATGALREAMEMFFDMRRLIEAVYAQESNVHAALQRAAEDPELILEMSSTLEQAVQQDDARLQRLGGMLQQELEKIAGPQDADPGSNSADPDAAQAEQQRFLAAQQLVGDAQAEMELLASLLTGIAGQEDVGDLESPRAEAEQASRSVLDKIEALRRLFFSLIEHLRDTGRRQAELLDETNTLAGDVDRQSPSTLGPLSREQSQLQQIAEQIAVALQQQAEQTTTASESQAAQVDPDSAARFRQASELVRQAQTEMSSAVQGLEQMADSAPRDFSPVLEHQQTSLEKIAEALQVLDASEPNQEQNQDQQQEQEQQDQQQEQQQDQQQQQEQQQQDMNARELLQLIRDREAERRRDQQRARRVSGGGVEKDW